MLCTQKDRNFYENSQGQIPRTPIRFIGSISKGYHKQQLIIQYENETATITMYDRGGADALGRVLAGVLLLEGVELGWGSLPRLLT